MAEQVDAAPVGKRLALDIDARGAVVTGRAQTGEPVILTQTALRHLDADQQCVDRILDLGARVGQVPRQQGRSEEHTSELQSLMRISYAVFCLKKKTNSNQTNVISKNDTEEIISHTL